MDIKGSQTERILRNALERELKTSFRYLYFAETARRAGMDQLADTFEATSRNEMEHARHEFELLGGAGESLQNLDQAIQTEVDEAYIFYPQAAEAADKEGFKDAADFFRRMSQVEKRHEQHFKDVKSSIEQGAEFQGKTVGHSLVEMAQVMLPDQANPGGFVHGGELMKIMDNAAAVVAVRHCRSTVVTARVENIEFRTPVQVGDLIIVHGKLVFVSHSSMEVYIEVEAEDTFHGHTGGKRPALNAFFTMVALDQNGKATGVQPLILSTEEEEKLFKASENRYLARKNAAVKQ